MTTGIELATGSDDDATRQAGTGTRQYGAGFCEQRCGEQSEVAAGRARTQTHVATTSRPLCARHGQQGGVERSGHGRTAEQAIRRRAAA
jgi:hypothetical protein